MTKRSDSSWTATRERISRWWTDFQWPIVGAMVVIAFALTYAGGVDQDQPFWERMYRTMVAFGLARPTLQDAQSWSVAIARWLLVFAALFAVLKAWGAIFQEQAQRLRLRSRAGHVIICGGGDQGFLLATAFRERGDEVVLIERDPGSAGLQGSSERGIISIVGNALDHQLLLRAGIQRASSMLALCGDDGINAEIAARAQTLLQHPARAHSLNCFVHIGDLDLYHLIREREMYASERAPVRLQCFNIYDSGARVLLREHPLVGRPDPQSTPHAVIVGLGGFGESLTLHAARARHAVFGNTARLGITVVDLEASKRVENLCSRYAALRNTCSFLTYDLDVRSPMFQEGTFLTQATERQGPISAVYFCLRDEPAAISAALSLRHALRQLGLRAVVRVRQDAGLVALVAPGSAFSAAEIQFFGLLPRACEPEVVLNGTNEILARAIHDHYVEAQSANGDTPATNSSLVRWDELPPSLKEMNRNQADHIAVKLKSVGCRIAPLVDWTQPPLQFASAEIERLAVMEHERWMTQMTRDGWSLHPGSKDAARKRHPNLVAWDQLNDADKEKDRQAVREIPSLLARVGFRAVRVGLFDD